jgi:DNA-binding NtrC family response regulator
VDDEQLLLCALERAFKGRSLDIKTANSTEQALAEIAHCNFDLFLLDFDWHDLGRQKLLQAVDECCPYVPIIIMTTSSRESGPLNEVIKSTRKHGAWHLLEKPFSLDRMIHLIEVIFQDQDNVKSALHNLAQNFDREKRYQYRRPHVQPVHFSFKTIAAGESRRVSVKGILTDINDCGSGLLSHVQLQPNQVISFEDDFVKQNGVVAWSVMIEKETCRFGVQFY